MGQASCLSVAVEKQWEVFPKLIAGDDRLEACPTNQNRSRFGVLVKSLASGIVILLTATGSLGAPLFSEHDKQVDALLAQMTLDEKIGQMVQVDSSALKDNVADVQKYFLGSVLSGGASDPPAGNSARDWLDFVTEFKNQALQTRLKIPLLYGIDAVHGHNNVDGAVIFPHNIGLGATHDSKLVERAGRVTAEEVAGTGIRWAFAPCVTVPQDERWGRTYEGFSDNAALVSQLGAAAVRGFQGNKLSAGTTLPCSPAPNISSATAARPTALTRATPFATRRRCGNYICRRITRPSRPASVPSWFPTAVGTARKCTATNICSPTF